MSALSARASLLLYATLFWGGFSARGVLDRLLTTSGQRLAVTSVAFAVHGLLVVLAIVAVAHARRRAVASRAAVENHLRGMGGKR